MRIEHLHSILLHGSKNGSISLANIEEPYGAKSDDVLSIGICLKDNQVEWKVHIPYENLEELINALEAINNKR